MTEIDHLAEQIPCGVYKHYKGKRYYVLGLGRQHPSDEVVVIYCRLYGREGLPLSVRRAEDFLGNAVRFGQEVPRFTYVGLRERGDGEAGAQDAL